MQSSNPPESISSIYRSTRPLAQGSSSSFISTNQMIGSAAGIDPGSASLARRLGQHASGRETACRDLKVEQLSV